MNQPLISVIVPCYNQAQYMDECLQSVLDQTYQNWECIIVNDGSPDNTEEVARRWLNKDSRFRYFYKDNGGAGSARNLGLKKSNGTWIQFLDGDDFINKDKLSLVEKVELKINFIYTDFNLYSNGEILPPFCDLSRYQLTISNLITYWDNGFNIPIHCPIIKRELIGDLRFIDEFKLHEDWLFWIMLFNDKDVNVKFDNNAYAFYRDHTLNTTKDQNKLELNSNKVYNYAYNTVLNSENKAILFASIVSKYTISRSQLFINIKELDKLRNNKYFRMRRFLYKILKF